MDSKKFNQKSLSWVFDSYPMRELTELCPWTSFIVTHILENGSQSILLLANQNSRDLVKISVDTEIFDGYLD